MNKSNYIYKSNIIETIFFFFLVLIVLMRLDINLNGVKVVEALFERLQFYFVPIATCVMSYRVHRYYQNTFCMIRYSDLKQWKIAFIKENMKANLLILGIFYLIIFVCCFDMDLDYFIYIGILLLNGSLILSLCSLVSVQCSIKNKFTMSYLFCMGLHLFYRMIVMNLFLDYTIYENFLHIDSLMFYFVGFIFLCLNILMLAFMFGKLNWKIARKKSVIYILCLLLFVFESSIFRNLSVQESIGFPNIMFISVNEILMPLFLWILSTVVLISITVYVMFTNYRSHLLFYAIRIQNRTIWFLKTFLKGTIGLMIVLTLKYVIQEFYHIQTMSYGMYIVEGVFRIQLLSLFLFLIYQVYKNEKLFSYGLLVFIIVIFFCVTTQNGNNIVLMRVHNVETIIWMAVFTVCMLVANCYAINHLDYY